MKFTIERAAEGSDARAGVLQTSRGTIKTPIFMPVGTAGTVKGIPQHELKESINAEIILGNTYHLYLRPGLEVLESAGGLHKFINWDRPMLTDSGGYQVYSLSNNRKIEEEGVKFRSHIDGSSHLFTPERVMDIQRSIGADIVMAFDECTPYPCERGYARRSMEMTHRWFSRCKQRMQDTEDRYGHPQELFPIVQGSVYKDLRQASARFVADQGAAGNAIGGLSVGESHEEMYEMTEVVCAELPKEKPRYLMGVGTPANILECIDRGVDMFDCVLPTRNGRNAYLYTKNGIMNLKNKKYASDFGPLDPEGESHVDQTYSRSYVRHLFHSNELLATYIGTQHNLSFYLWLVREARRQLLAGTFPSWKKDMVERVSQRI